MGLGHKINKLTSMHVHAFVFVAYALFVFDILPLREAGVLSLLPVVRPLTLVMLSNSAHAHL